MDHRVNDIMTASMVALPDGQRRVFRRLRNVETFLSVKDGLDPETLRFVLNRLAISVGNTDTPGRVNHRRPGGGELVPTRM